MTPEFIQKIAPYFVKVWSYIACDADPDGAETPEDKVWWVIDADRLITIGEMPRELYDQVMAIDNLVLVKTMSSYLK